MSLAQTSIRLPPSVGRLSLVSAYKILKPYSRPERTPTPKERDLLARLLDILLPTVLKPFEHHGEVETRNKSTATGLDTTGSQVEQKMIKTFTLFVEKMPSLLAFELDTSYSWPSSALTEAISLRMNGMEHKAACILRKIVDDPSGTADWARLQFFDSLWHQHLLGSHSEQSTPSVSSMRDITPVQCAILALTDAGRIFSAQATSGLFQLCAGSEVQSMLANISLGESSSEELFGLICYNHAVILCARFASISGSECQERLVGPSKKALRTLLQIWAQCETRSFGADGSELVRWRCTLALNEVLPFSDRALRVPAPQDTLSLLASEQYIGVSPAVLLLRGIQELPRLDDTHIEHFARHLEKLCAADDLRGIDEFVWALQLSRHADLSTLQTALRRLGWSFHCLMNPRAQWILDGLLLHPLALWVGCKCQERSADQFLSARLVRHPIDAKISVPEESDFPHLSRLRFGFGGLGTATADVGRFICAWSIMYHCLQYTPDPLRDELYAMLYTDHDTFSFSQLCYRVKQVLRSLPNVPDLMEVSLDGFDERYRHIAGLGVLNIPGDSEDAIHLLQKELDGLYGLEKDIRKWVRQPNRSDSPGIQHLLGVCAIYQGQVRVAIALQQVRVQPGRAYSPPIADRRVIESKAELLRAQAIFEGAFEMGRKLLFGEVTRQAGEGMLSIHDILFDQTASRDEPLSWKRRKAQSRLRLCERLHSPLQARMIQVLGTQPYILKFTKGERDLAFTTAPQSPVTRLYAAAELSLREMGRVNEALGWREHECEAVNQSLRMTMFSHAARQSVWLSGDAPLSSRGDLSREVLGCMQSRMDDAPDHSPPQPIYLPPEEPWDDQLLPDLPLPDPMALIANLCTSTGDAVFAFFGLRDETSVQVDILRAGYDIVTRQIDLTPVFVGEQQRFYLRSVRAWEVDHDERLQELGGLIVPLVELTHPHDLIVICPGTICAGLPIHGILVSPNQALNERNPIVYAPNLNLLRNCVDTALPSPPRLPKPWSAIVADVIEDAIEAQSATQLDTIQRDLRATADGWGKGLDETTARIHGVDVTKAAFCAALQEYRAVFFVGHGFGGLLEDGRVLPPSLSLHGTDELRLSDLSRLTLPASLVILFACASSKVRVKHGTELSSLMTATLLAGGAAGIGAACYTDTEVADKLGIYIAGFIKRARQQGAILHIARVVQNCFMALRKEDVEVREWCPYSLQGSPRVNLGWGCPGPSSRTVASGYVAI